MKHLIVAGGVVALALASSIYPARANQVTFDASIPDIFHLTYAGPRYPLSFDSSGFSVGTDGFGRAKFGKEILSATFTGGGDFSVTTQTLPGETLSFDGIDGHVVWSNFSGGMTDEPTINGTFFYGVNGQFPINLDLVTSVPLTDAEYTRNPTAITSGATRVSEPNILAMLGIALISTWFLQRRVAR